MQIKRADLTRAEPPPEHGRSNLLVCNPPYVRHHHLTKEAKAFLPGATKQTCGVEIGGLSGLYCHFLGLSHE